ncbi:MAG: ABC transporter permease subunit [Anaerolineae bacterium]
MRERTFWQRLAYALGDRSLIAGATIVGLLLIVAVLGPELAPHNPFHVDRIQTINGEIGRAPFPPSSTYWLGTDDQGRDTLSLLLYGARQTLTMAVLATVARILLGLLLGTIAGWWHGKAVDRVLMSMVEFLAPFPTLILAIALILAMGIQRGQISFIIALCLVGWGEVAQVVRSHVLAIRHKLYVEAARALGLSEPEIISRHALPNLLPTLLALAALEMGGVLLLLGELGFVKIFIGGGTTYLDEAIGIIHFFDVPDWGAMLGTSWRYFSAAPWLPLAPAIAFFVSILGFNLFGFGFQRFVERGRFHPSGWSLLRFALVVGVILFISRTIMRNTGIEAHYTKMAQEFNTDRALADIGFLADPDLEGRPTGPGGGHDAAGYIATEFKAIGLTPILPSASYFQTYDWYRGRMTMPPGLALLDAEGNSIAEFVAGEDFSLAPGYPFQAEGSAQAELVVVGNLGMRLLESARGEKVLMLLDPEEELRVYWGMVRQYVGVLRVVPDSELAPAGMLPSLEEEFRWLDEYPTFLIGESCAREILSAAGYDLVTLREDLARRAEEDALSVPLGVQARLEFGLEYEETTAVNVIGYIPGVDIESAGDRILVAAYYTGPPPSGDGTIYPGADENGSGVAVMLEIARLWREQGFEPKKTVIFAALDAGGGRYLLHHPIYPCRPSDSWLVIEVEGVGAGEQQLSSESLGELGLSRILRDSAGRSGVRVNYLGEAGFFFGEADDPYNRADQAYSGLRITRLGDELSGGSLDTLDHVDPELLGEAGRVVDHLLMVLSTQG